MMEQELIWREEGEWGHSVYTGDHVRDRDGRIGLVVQIRSEREAVVVYSRDLTVHCDPYSLTVVSTVPWYEHDEAEG